MPPVPDEILKLSKAIRHEDGLREKLLAAKCRWERMSRTAVLMQYGDPQDWSQYQEGEDC